MTIPRRPFWPTLANTIFKACEYIQKHQQVLKAVVLTVDPGSAAEVNAAFDAIVAACALFLEVMSHVDPNWKPN